MSRELITLMGETENDFAPKGHGVEYKDQELIVTAFWGGKMRKQFLQLTIGDRYVQLSNAQVTQLIRALLEGFKLDELK